MLKPLALGLSAALWCASLASAQPFFTFTSN